MSNKTNQTKEKKERLIFDFEQFIMYAWTYINCHIVNFIFTPTPHSKFKTDNMTQHTFFLSSNPLWIWKLFISARNTISVRGQEGIHNNFALYVPTDLFKMTHSKMDSLNLLSLLIAAHRISHCSHWQNHSLWKLVWKVHQKGTWHETFRANFFFKNKNKQHHVMREEEVNVVL